jgi:hypothetical protein
VTGNATFGTLGAGTGMFWDNTNNRLGIGNSAPTYNLDIVSVSSPNIRITRNGATEIRIGASTLATGGLIGTYSASPLIFLSNSAESMRLFTTGNVSIGSTTDSGRLAVRGSGATSATTTFLVQNSTPTTLFQIQDHGSSSFAGNLTVSGSTLIGNITAPALNDTTKVTANSGVTTIYAIPTASYDGAFFDYVVRSGSNARAGQIMGLWSGSSVNFTETTTTDFGSTSNFTFGMSISSSNMILSSSATSNGWTVKAIVRSI